MLPTLNRAVKMPKPQRISRNRTACSPSLTHVGLWNQRWLPTSSSPQNLGYVSSTCQYLSYGTPNNCCGIGSLLDVGPLVHLLKCSAGTIRKQTQSRDSGGSRVPGFGSPNERERDSKVGSPGCKQWQRKIIAGTRWTSTSDRSRANRDSEMEMGTFLARDARTGRS